MVLETTWLLIELAILFFGVTFAVQLFQRRMGTDRFRTWMGGRPIVAALKGIAIGFMTPFCTFTAVPMLMGLRQAGVPPAGYVAFIVAAPVLDPVLFGALILIVGLDAAAIYLAIAFVAAVLLALLAQAIGVEKHLKPVGEGVVSCSAATGAPWAGRRTEFSNAAKSALSLLRVMGPLLLVGVALSLVIEAAVPPSVTAELTQFSPRFAIPIAAAIGTPLYVSTGVFVPVADSLSSAGVGIGAIVALTIAGAGANIPEFVILSKLARPRVIGIFFTYVFGVAVVGGLLAQAVVT